MQAVSKNVSVPPPPHPQKKQLPQEEIAVFPVSINPEFAEVHVTPLHQEPVVDSNEFADVEECYLC